MLLLALQKWTARVYNLSKTADNSSRDELYLWKYLSICWIESQREQLFMYLVDIYK